MQKSYTDRLNKVNFQHFREPRSRRRRHEMARELNMLFITVWTQHGVSFASVEHDLDDRQTRQSREKMRKFPRRPDA